MPFETFTHKGGRAKYGFPVVTLQASGGMALNDLAYDLLGRPSHIVLLYDRKERLIGFQPGRAEQTYAFPIRNAGGAGEASSWALSTRSFYAYYELQPEATQRFKATKQDDIVVIDLKSPITTLKVRARAQRAGARTARNGEQGASA